MYVKNANELLNHGETELRRMLLDAIEFALDSVDPYRLMKELFRLNGDLLEIGDLQFDLHRTERIYVLGAGKASFPIAKALEETLGNRISDGLITVKDDETGTLSKIKVRRAGHPIPNEAGYSAAQEIVKIASAARHNDLYLAVFTGGSSALMPYPAEGISLEDKRQVTRSIKDRLRSSFNVAVAELDPSPLWNQATIGVVSVSDSRDYLDGLMKNVERAATRIANNAGAEVTDSFVEFL